MSSAYDILRNMPIESYDDITRPDITQVRPIVRSGNTAILPVSRGRKVLEGAKSVGRAGVRGVGGGILGAIGGGFYGIEALNNAAISSSGLGVDLVEDMFLFGASRGGVVGAAAGIGMGVLNPALRSLASSTAESVARGTRRVGRRVSKTLKRTPGSRSVPINNVINRGAMPPIVRQVDDDVTQSIADLVRQTIDIEQSKLQAARSASNMPTQPMQNVINLILGGQASSQGFMPVGPNATTQLTPVIGTPSSVTSAVTPPSASSSVIAGSGIPSSASASASSPVAPIPAATTSAPTASIPGPTAPPVRSPAPVIPTGTPSRVPAGRMGKSTKYGIFAAGLLAGSVVMNARAKRSESVKMNQQTSPYQNSVRNQYVPA